MSEHTTLTQFCLLCYKTIEIPNETSKTADNINRFVKIVKRFAKHHQIDNFCDLFEDNRLIGCCPKCNLIIEDVCESFKQHQILELKLDFMLGRLVDKINYANKVPARGVHLNRILEESYLIDLEYKAKFQTRIRKFRQNIVEAGRHRRLRSQPRVWISREINVHQLTKPFNTARKRTAVKYLNLGDSEIEFEDGTQHNNLLDMYDYNSVNNYDTTEEVECTYNNEFAGMSNSISMQETATFEDPLIQIKVEHLTIFEPTETTNKTFDWSPNDNPGPGVYDCTNCGKIFKSAYCLQVHLEYHKDPKDWKWSCETCEKKFATKHNLQAHMRSHKKKSQGNSTPNHVNTLNKKTTSTENASQEIRYSLRKNRITKFVDEKGSEDENDSKDVEFISVDSCSNTTIPTSEEELQKKTASKLERHILKRGRGRPKSNFTSYYPKIEIECKICNKKFSSLLKKDKHFQLCHDLTQSKTKEYYPCKIDSCTAYFLTRLQVCKHRLYDHGNKRMRNMKEKKKCLKCPKCEKKFNQKNHLERHMEYHKDPSEWKHECEYCGKKFALKNKFESHLRIHTDDKQYNCRFCGERFLRSEQIKKHVFDEHQDEDFNIDEVANESVIKEGKFKSISTFSTNRKICKATKIHYNRKIGNVKPKPHVLECNICKRKFTSFIVKEIHFKRFHDLSKLVDKNKVEKCGAIGCNAYFLEKCQLKHHNSMEHGSGALYKKKRNFKCEECGNLFENRFHLGVHLKYHKDPSEWKFECETCGRKCATKQKLKAHVRTHTKERPFQCQFCVEKFGSSSTLKTHLVNKHNDEEEIRAELDGMKFGKRGNESKMKNRRGKKTKVNNDTVLEKIREGNDVSNGSNQNNILIRKGDCFGDGTLLEIEDLD